MKQTTKILLNSAFHFFLYTGVIFFVGSTHQSAPIHPEKPFNQPKPTINKVVTNSPKTSIQLANVAPKKSSETRLSSPTFAEVKASVQKEVEYHMFATPNDPNYAGDWTLAKINAPTAWNISTGNGQTVVAVIDTGFALDHEDLSDRWNINSNETGMTKQDDRCWTGTSIDKKVNNCDDDNNGYIDDWQGWNFIFDDNNPQTGRQNNTGSGVRHASEVSGIIGSRTNNGVGIASLSWNTKIMPLQALDDNGSGYTSSVVAAVYYAIDNGANVINLSLGAYTDDSSLKTAIRMAISQNIVVVAAAGNCGDGNSSECSGVPAGTVAYPAAYSDVIAVGASTQSDQRASYSSYGQAVDVVAPGDNVPMSTGWSISNQTSSYATNLYGTSFAAPFVSSLAALIKSIRPSTSVADVTAIINATATKPASMNGILYTPELGHGIIDAGAALTVATLLNSTSNTPTLLQAGSYRSEHTTSTNDIVSSGCLAAPGSVCTIELTSSNSYKRYLPYSLLPGSGGIGWTWSTNMLESANWEIRSRQGEKTSTTPYLLLKK